ncbi:unnamed protein product [Trichogramma brassicae]|uniref:Reverse transcriptase domain-containing protein n=1 Tax=Trichogramma brassicae TaxID=86971 RepID=A0A6H5IWQ9_9HYME|nr:unnamed protein product [Trichogramma brassicae]
MCVVVRDSPGREKKPTGTLCVVCEARYGASSARVTRRRGDGPGRARSGREPGPRESSVSWRRSRQSSGRAHDLGVTSGFITEATESRRSTANDDDVNIVFTDSHLRRLGKCVQGRVVVQEREGTESLQRCLADGVIERSASAWSSAPVIVKKADGSDRFCIDYRDLNKVTKKRCVSGAEHRSYS